MMLFTPSSWACGIFTLGMFCQWYHSSPFPHPFGVPAGSSLCMRGPRPLLGRGERRRKSMAEEKRQPASNFRSQGLSTQVRHESTLMSQPFPATSALLPLRDRLHLQGGRASEPLRVSCGPACLGVGLLVVPGRGCVHHLGALSLLHVFTERSRGSEAGCRGAKRF